MATSTPPHPQHYQGLLLACICERGRIRARRESNGDDVPVLYVVQPNDEPLTVEVFDFSAPAVEEG
jgi:hypothetical protein